MPLAPDAAARFQQARALYEAQRLPEAEMALRTLLGAAPGHVDATHLLGLIALLSGRPEAATGMLAQGVKLAPSNADLHWNLGSALLAHGQPDPALASFRRAVRLKPNAGELHRKLGDVLRDLGRAEEAKGRYDRAIALRPGDAWAHHNRALACKTLGQIGPALGGLRHALQLAPEHPQAHYNLGIMLLLTGAFEEGWKEYEWRWRMPNFKRRDCPQPVWQGEPLAGRTLLIHAEQGFGDTVQFCRFVPDLARANPVILQAPRAAMRLLSTLADAPRIIGPDDPAPHFDVYCSLMSLPALLGPRCTALPGAVPYLAADRRDVARWQGLLGPSKGLRVGLAWAGSPVCAADAQRSLTLAQLRPLLSVPGVEFVSLQKGQAGGDGLADWTAALDDFADTAAMIQTLDLVISVDTAVAHLAGALGKPVWLLNRFDPCWRWLLNRDDSPWYPTLRQFRQAKPGAWHEVVARVSAALQQQAAPARGPPQNLNHILPAAHSAQPPGPATWGG